MIPPRPACYDAEDVDEMAWGVLGVLDRVRGRLAALGLAEAVAVVDDEAEETAAQDEDDEED